MKNATVKKWQLDLRPRNIITHKFDLNELASCKIYDQQVEYCLKSLHLIFSGATRLVFEYGDYVVKVAKVSSGMMSNFYEADQVKLCPELFPKVVSVHQAKKDRYDFIVSEKVIPFNYSLFESKVGVSWQEMFSLLVWMSMKDVRDSKVRQIWLSCYNARMRCSIQRVKEVYEQFMQNKNAISDFINRALKYCANFDLQLQPNVVSDFTCRNLGWSEKNQAIVILDNGCDVHTNAIYNICIANKQNAKGRKLLQMIHDGKISSQAILDIRKNK